VRGEEGPLEPGNPGSGSVDATATGSPAGEDSFVDFSTQVVEAGADPPLGGGQRDAEPPGSVFERAAGHVDQPYCLLLFGRQLGERFADEAGGVAPFSHLRRRGRAVGEELRVQGDLGVLAAAPLWVYWPPPRFFRLAVRTASRARRRTPWNNQARTGRIGLLERQYSWKATNVALMMPS